MTTKKHRGLPGRSGVSLLLLQTREIGAAEFKARCLEVMDEVERLGIEVVITKHRRPVARLLPVQAGARSGFCGSLAGAILAERDIVRPIDADWEADEPHLT